MDGMTCNTNNYMERIVVLPPPLTPLAMYCFPCLEIRSHIHGYGHDKNYNVEMFFFTSATKGEGRRVFTRGRIWMKFGGQVGCVTRTN